MKVVFYAHCMAIYNTPQEARDIVLLEALGFKVLNPNTRTHSLGYDAYGMAYSETLLLKNPGCDIVAFRALPDGRIPRGVATEIEIAQSNDIPIIELPSCVLGRIINLEQTREYLREVGQR